MGPPNKLAGSGVFQRIGEPVFPCRLLDYGPAKCITRGRAGCGNRSLDSASQYHIAWRQRAADHSQALCKCHRKYQINISACSIVPGYSLS